MTPDETDDLGRWLAENVMEWRLLPPSGAMNQSFWENRREEFQYWAEPGFQKNIWSPTRSLSQAFQVVEEMRKKGWSFDMDWST